MPCATEDCPNEARNDVESGLCWACTAQKRRNGKVVGATPRHESAWDRLTEAAITYADRADAWNKAEFAKAKDQLRKAAKAYGPTDHAARTREGMQKARAAGVLIHRPPKLTPAAAMAALVKEGSAKRASAKLGVSLRTLRRALKAHRDAVANAPILPPVSALMRSRDRSARASSSR